MRYIRCQARISGNDPCLALWHDFCRDISYLTLFTLPYPSLYGIPFSSGTYAVIGLRWLDCSYWIAAIGLQPLDLETSNLTACNHHLPIESYLMPLNSAHLPSPSGLLALDATRAPLQQAEPFFVPRLLLCISPLCSRRRRSHVVGTWRPDSQDRGEPRCREGTPTSSRRLFRRRPQPGRRRLSLGGRAVGGRRGVGSHNASGAHPLMVWPQEAAADWRPHSHRPRSTSPSSPRPSRTSPGDLTAWARSAGTRRRCWSRWPPRSPCGGRHTSTSPSRPST